MTILDMKYVEAKAQHTTPYVLDSVTIFALSFFRTRNSNLIEIIIVESKKKEKTHTTDSRPFRIK